MPTYSVTYQATFIVEAQSSEVARTVVDENIQIPSLESEFGYFDDDKILEAEEVER